MNKTNGFTLIEVLIALIVLAVGLLGLAGLQATSLRNNQSSYNRMKATQLAYDIADRMRANYAEAKMSGNAYLVTKDKFPTSPVTECTSVAGCDPEIMAKNDLYEWKQALADGLPDGTGEINLEKGVLTITISWTENRDEDDKKHVPDITTFLMSFQI